MSEPKISISRDGIVTAVIGRVEEVTLDEELRAAAGGLRFTRWFHNGADHSEQHKGFGYRTKNEAARSLAKVKEVG